MGGFLNRLMYGRYGTDSLNNFIVAVWILLAVVNLFVGSVILYFLGIVCMVLALFRIFSRNIAKRQRENNKFMDMTKGIRTRFSNLRTKHNQKKYFRFFKCPSCKAVLRMPKKPGLFNITCTKCGHKFTKKIKG